MTHDEEEEPEEEEEEEEKEAPSPPADDADAKAGYSQQQRQAAGVTIATLQALPPNQEVTVYLDVIQTTAATAPNGYMLHTVGVPDVTVSGLD